MALRDMGSEKATPEELEDLRRDEEDVRWWNEQAPKLEEKYRGRHVAIVNREAVVADTYEDAYRQAKAKYPDREPLMDYIPFKREVWVL